MKLIPEDAPTAESDNGANENWKKEIKIEMRKKTSYNKSFFLFFTFVKLAYGYIWSKFIDNKMTKLSIEKQKNYS